MGNKSHASFFLIFLALLCFHSVLLRASSDKIYIVRLEEGERKLEDSEEEHVTESHLQILISVLGSKEDAINSIIYSYGLSGFAAKLSRSQAQKIAELPEVICISPNRMFKPLTTRSWDFLGVDNSEPFSLLRRANYGENIIIGVIDTGIWPEAKSFRDEGYGPVPAQWKGKCMPGERFDVHNCNRKLVGARYYKNVVTTELQKGDYFSPRDSGFHGTHVASIAAGNNVSNVHVSQMPGLPIGAARGGAPRARIAVYNVCWAGSVCSEIDMTKAVVDAIEDGVDVISMSLGSQGYLLETLKAVKNGIPVILAGGNDGPTPMTITNEAPWAITVAATTIDRSFPTVFTLGDGQKLVGQSFYSNKTKNLELVAPNCPRRPLCSCSYKTLKDINVKGKVVFCYDPYNSDDFSPRKTLQVAFSTVHDMGAKGLILAQYPFNQIGSLNPEFPCILVDFEIAQRISDYYLRSSTRPLVKIQSAKYAISREVAPRVAAFSSRGPSARQPELLKPDIAAPGHAIVGAGGYGFLFLSGTSMAAPHVSAVVALLKAIHPDWSPAVIKSALITTASVTDAYGMPLVAEGTPRKLADPFDFGGGQINPNRAVDPGLVYDIDPSNYGTVHCSKVFVANKGEDCRFKLNEPEHDINLPSIALPYLKKKLTVTRTVTNVAGYGRAIYKAVIDSPPGVKMVVHPSTLVFHANAKVKTFNVTFTPIRSVQGIYHFGSLAWDDGGAHYVRIPIAVRTVIKNSYADAS